MNFNPSLEESLAAYIYQGLDYIVSVLPPGHPMALTPEFRGWGIKVCFALALKLLVLHKTHCEREIPSFRDVI